MNTKWLLVNTVSDDNLCVTVGLALNSDRSAKLLRWRATHGKVLPLLPPPCEIENHPGLCMSLRVSLPDDWVAFYETKSDDATDPVWDAMLTSQFDKSQICTNLSVVMEVTHDGLYFIIRDGNDTDVESVTALLDWERIIDFIEETDD